MHSDFVAVGVDGQHKKISVYKGYRSSFDTNVKLVLKDNRQKTSQALKILQ